MKVMLGECTGRVATQMEALGWGRMWIARGRNIYTYPGEPWGFDNGAFRDWTAGQPFDGDTYMRCVEKAEQQRTSPYLAILPDVVAGGWSSLDFSLGWIEKLPSFPWYVAVQDGMTPEAFPELPSDVVGLFLGGSTPFKGTARAWRDLATARGLLFHYGRAGTLPKVAHAMRVGADSLDSAFPMWTKQRMRDFTEAVLHGPPQYELVWEGA